MIANKIREFIYRRYNISFSKAGEDMQLMKLIIHRTPGVYVDIGCWHPVIASNTYLFYIHGWKGICIDPNPELRPLYQKFRPTDIFENCALGSQDLNLKYYMLPDSSMNTLDYGFIEKRELQSQIQQVLDVPTIPLATILERHLQPGDRLDFFDVDVEGYDLEVLKTNDWERFRPRFLVVESDLPLKEDLDSEMHDYLSSVDYTIIGKVITKGNLGNTFYIDNRL
jgi:FkbM family methyltransferase